MNNDNWIGYVILMVVCCSILIATGIYAGYKDDVDMSIVDQVVSNRFTKAAKKAVEKTDGMSEAEREYRMEWLLRELNEILEDNKYTAKKKQYEKSMMDLEWQIEALRNRIRRTEEELLRINEMLEKEKARIQGLSGDEIHKEFQKMLNKDNEK